MNHTMNLLIDKHLTITCFKKIHTFIFATIGLALISTSIFAYYYKFVIRGYSHTSSAMFSFDPLFLFGIILFTLCFFNLNLTEKILCFKIVACTSLSYFFGTHLVFTNIFSLPSISVYRILRTCINIMALSFCISCYPIKEKYTDFMGWFSLFTLMSMSTFFLAYNRISIFNPYSNDFTQIKLIQTPILYCLAFLVYIINTNIDLISLKSTEFKEEITYESNK